jgi:hypothetical protein
MVASIIQCYHLFTLTHGNFQRVWSDSRTWLNPLHVSPFYSCSGNIICTNRTYPATRCLHYLFSVSYKFLSVQIET